MSSLSFWTNVRPLQPGTTARSDDVNNKLEGISVSGEALANHINKFVFSMPASYTGNPQLPAVPLINAFLGFDAQGNAAVFSRASFDSAVAQAQTAASSASEDAADAEQSKNQARQSELAAAASAELAQSIAGPIVAGVFYAGNWNASSGSYPAAPESGSSIWKASANGTGPTAAIKSGDFIMYDRIGGSYQQFVGAARVAAIEQALATAISSLEDQIKSVETLAMGGISL